MKTLAQHAADLSKHPKVDFSRVKNGSVEVKLHGGAGVFVFGTHAALQQWAATHLLETEQ